MTLKANYLSKVEVYTKDIEQNPYCPHGPSVLFERIFQDGRQKKFYACSACRDRKLCPFYLEEEQVVKKNENRENILQKEISLYNKHESKFKNYLKLLSSINEKKVYYYCETCNLLFGSNDKKNHDKCKFYERLTEEEMKSPSHIFSPKSESKFQAQYFFTDESLKVIIKLMGDLQIKKVLCIGVPSVYEYVRKNLNIKSFLLDIDDRYCNFFSTKDFCVYNMFNHYFFGGHKSREEYEQFLSEKQADKILVIIDPPFGGRVELISNTLSLLEKDWKKQNKIIGDKILPVALIFPYFHEKSVKLFMPNFNMLDYQVNYVNHVLYAKGPKAMKQGSAVRIFTNLSPHLFLFPSAEGYKFCKDCNRSVHPRNFHCYKCGGCTSKDGRTYVHCDLCGICVKPIWIHCQSCNKCVAKEHRCIESKRNKRKNSEESKRRRNVSHPFSKKKKLIPQTLSEEKLRDLSVLEELFSSK